MDDMTFLARYVPRAAAYMRAERAAQTAAARPQPQPTAAAAPRPIMPAARIETPEQQEPSTTMSPENEILLRTLMAHPNSHEMLPFKGERLPVHEILKRLMKGEGATVHDASAPPNSGSAIEPSQAAVNALSAADRDALQSGEGIEGMTGPNRTRIHARESGTGHLDVKIARNDSTGKFERTQLDWSGFYGPGAGDEG